MCSINLKFWEITWIIWPNVFRNFGVPSSKRSQFMATIVKKKEWRATPSVINEILRNFQKFQVWPISIFSEVFVKFWDELHELLKGCVWVVTFGPPCILNRFVMSINFQTEWTIHKPLKELIYFKTFHSSYFLMKSVFTLRPFLFPLSLHPSEYTNV